MIAIQEVGPRDGLQNEPVRLSTAEKIAFIERLAATGLRRIEAVSFVHPERVPQMADAEAVWAGFRRASGVTYAGLVLNRRGFERARTAGVEEIHFAFGVTETFNRKNQGAAPEASFRQFAATPATPAWPTSTPPSRRAQPSSMRRSAAWAAAPLRRMRPATSPRKISSTCGKAWACRPASTSTPSSGSPAGLRAKSAAGWKGW
ncbi:MAG: Hydroxymethylglutaryl-CoA lyase [Hydrogenibacillus schlegelii]|uniref:Hydroxymethylglutaryl-CoA lyase n=1 Tax=Hydrogenibacillus schlegelii TaxID=1484 RepID=A0A2T5GE28_HYDSH|nr:MAG: Hydroxymethylglutaryl-CoA lyase [Hydrogenibacillus schlegelii]